MQKFVKDSGKHIALGEQHVSTMHTEVFDTQVYVVLLHGSKMEHRIPGAQYLPLLIELYSKQGVDVRRQLLLLFEFTGHCCKEQFAAGCHAE
jgi:hypothetical protein